MRWPLCELTEPRSIRLPKWKTIPLFPASILSLSFFPLSIPIAFAISSEFQSLTVIGRGVMTYLIVLVIVIFVSSLLCLRRLMRYQFGAVFSHNLREVLFDDRVGVAASRQVLRVPMDDQR